MSLSKRLKELRHQNNMTATYVSSQLGIAKSTLSNYENGVRTPKAEMLGKFAEFYNTTVDYMFGFDNGSSLNSSCRRNVGTTKKFTSIPILGAITKNEPEEFTRNIIGYTDLGSEYTGKGDYFAMYVIGDSMNNCRICEGDIVIVRRQSKVENGEIAVVLVEGECATVKKVFTTENTISLIPCSTNPSHRPQIIDIENIKVEILGKVVEVKIKL